MHVFDDPIDGAGDYPNSHACTSNGLYDLQNIRLTIVASLLGLFGSEDTIVA